MPKNSLIDSDFIDDAEFNDLDLGDDDADDDAGKNEDHLTDVHESERQDFREQEVQKPKAKDKAAPELEVEIVDDTPEKDKGKWVADPSKDQDDDDPDEDEVKSYSKKVQKRLSDLTAKMHAERRRADQYDRQMKELVPLTQKYLTELNNLKGVVENGEKVLLGEHKGRLEHQLERAKIAFREATEAGDTNGVIAAQEEIARAVSQIERLAGYRPQQLQREDVNTALSRFSGNGQDVQNQQQAVTPTQQALEWRQKNPWFDKDIPMQAYALGIHRSLVDAGVEADSPEYYKKIDSEMRRRFPERFKDSGDGPRRRGSVVAPASRTGTTAPRKVTLTESQVRIARRLGLTPQQMAEQILAEQENAGKEFTHVKGR